MPKFIRFFDDVEPTLQTGGGPNIFERAILIRGELSREVSMGLITLEGPTMTDTGFHTDWRQAYLVISGCGTVLLDDEPFYVDRPCVVNIPLQCRHAVRLDAGEKMQYIFVNNYVSKE